MVDKMIRKDSPDKCTDCGWSGSDADLRAAAVSRREGLRRSSARRWRGQLEAIWQFNKEIVDTTYDLIPAVKPQIAMYEQFGIPGLMAFKKTVDYCKEKDLVVIGDIKRGDIGSTSAAYAAGHIWQSEGGKQEYLPALMRILRP